MDNKDLYQVLRESLPPSARRRSTWLALVQCFSSIERVLMRHFAHEYQSSLPRYDVLTALALNQEGLTMGELASMLMVTKGNITGVVRRLEREKLILRRTSATDRRVQSVRISAKGKRLWQKMNVDYDKIIAMLLKGESVTQLRATEKALQRTLQTVARNSASDDRD